MRPILLAATAALLVTLGGTPFAIRYFRNRGYGQLIRDNVGEIPSHAEKRGTPTAGGTMILAGIVAGYLAAHITQRVFSRAGALLLLVMVGMGVIGFVDDYIKFHHQRSLGINKTAKMTGQLIVSVGFGLLAQHWAHVSTHLSFVRDTALNLGPVFVLWVFLIMAASANGVNLTDGLDGLAAGSSAMVFAAYVVISFWQFRHPEFYMVRNPLDVAIVSAAGLGACAGFLWWNAAPAKIFMGDTGSLALGGGMAALAVMTSTQLLLVILGGLFVLETTSVILQIIGYHGLRRRVFKMAPLHHHFELTGWPEFTVIVRFWIIAGLAAALGLGLFYADFLARGGIG
jgi:phospho-N-acetylmuramoyl-pentapeptide-transferase